MRSMGESRPEFAGDGARRAAPWSRPDAMLRILRRSRAASRPAQETGSLRSDGNERGLDGQLECMKVVVVANGRVSWVEVGRCVIPGSGQTVHVAATFSRNA
jgi:hypothetical protein